MQTTKIQHISLSKAPLLKQWLQVNNVPQMGYIRLHQSACKLGCKIPELPMCSSAQLKSIGWSDVQIQALLQCDHKLQSQFKHSCEWLNASTSHHFIGLDSPHYPEHLMAISRPPLFVFAVGDIALLQRLKVAFVGSRKPSMYATQVTFELMQQLAMQTSAISVSGLALGIDAACHKASLANKLPTIAVLGCGVDVVYPKRHKQLYIEVAKNGLLVSEFLLGTQPVPSLFPRRNRIISGLSLGTVVVEAQIKSGSLVTAKYALEQNREVFAVPNNITNPNSTGCHWLIKQGAKLLESIDDITEELPSIAVRNVDDGLCKKNQKNSTEDFTSDPLLDSVDYSATSVDLIAKRTGMSLSDVLSKLLEYEMRGIVASSAEGYVKLRG